MEIAVSSFPSGSFGCNYECIANCCRIICREEEDADDFAFPLTLKSPKKSPMGSPRPSNLNGSLEATKA